ncbi:arsenical resistance protein ArsH [Rhodotorula toruloides]|nr:arsenical resistance protein ArsH [Rhodotorula toruloides]
MFCSVRIWPAVYQLPRLALAARTTRPRTSALPVLAPRLQRSIRAAMATASSDTAPASLSPTEADRLYRPFLVTKNAPHEPDWIDALDLNMVKRIASEVGRPLKVLVLYGSLRERSFSRLTAYEASRILHRLGVDVRVYDPSGMPLKDGTSERSPKVVELRQLSEWSDAQVWVSPEQHGTVTAVMKNQIDWIPLSVGSVRPTQGRTLAVVQVNGGSQSFNTVNTLRILGRWMRMFTIPNQSSIPKAWTQFTTSDRLIPSSNRDRLVDLMEELVKVTCILQPHFALLSDRYSEREEKREHGRLRTQAEIEVDAIKKHAMT